MKKRDRIAKKREKREDRRFRRAIMRGEVGRLLVRVADRIDDLAARRAAFLAALDSHLAEQRPDLVIATSAASHDK